MFSLVSLAGLQCESKVLTAILMRLSKWKRYLDACGRDEFNLVNLNLQDLIKPEETPKRDCVGAMQQTTCMTTAPVMKTFLATGLGGE